MSNIPAELKYSKSHEWVRVEGGDVAVIGITDHAQEELGDVVYVELPSVGRVLAYDDVFGTVESVKAVSELYAPLSGEVVAVNESLAGAEAAINESPYDTGWMIQLRLRNAPEAQSLLDAPAYRAQIGE
jgi:glycine cleavage system H protein